MPAPGRSRVPTEKVTLVLPKGLYDEIELIVRSEHRWMNVLDFIRWAVANEVDRWKKEHPLGAPRKP